MKWRCEADSYEMLLAMPDMKTTPFSILFVLWLAACGAGHVPGDSAERTSSAQDEAFEEWRESWLQSSPRGDLAPAREHDPERDAVGTTQSGGHEAGEGEVHVVTGVEVPRDGADTPGTDAEGGGAAPDAGRPDTTDDPDCAFALAAGADRGLRTNVAIEGDDGATHRVELVRAGDFFEFIFESRESDGFFRGADRLRCDRNTVSLVEAQVDEEELRFEPPLPILSEEGSTFEVDGTVFQSRAGVGMQERNISWSATVSSVSEGFDDLDADDRDFLLVDSMLVFHDTEITVETKTVWAVGVHDTFVARRAQRWHRHTPSGPGETPQHERIERTRLVYFD